MAFCLKLVVKMAALDTKEHIAVGNLTKKRKNVNYPTKQNTWLIENVILVDFTFSSTDLSPQMN